MQSLPVSQKNTERKETSFYQSCKISQELQSGSLHFSTLCAGKVILSFSNVHYFLILPSCHILQMLNTLLKMQKSGTGTPSGGILMQTHGRQQGGQVGMLATQYAFEHNAFQFSQLPSLRDAPKR